MTGSHEESRLSIYVPPVPPVGVSPSQTISSVFILNLSIVNQILASNRMRLAMVFTLAITSPLLNQSFNTVSADLTPGLVPPETKLGHHDKRDAKPRLRYVRDSGICETRKGVKTYSGYIPNDRNQSMFFWLFEAR